MRKTSSVVRENPPSAVAEIGNTDPVRVDLDVAAACKLSNV